VPKAKRRRRLVYRDHSDEEIRNELRTKIVEGSVLCDYLQNIVGSPVHERGRSDRECWVAEGMRVLADTMLAIATSTAPPKVETNQD
jgi:hypothetical protein